MTAPDTKLDFGDYLVEIVSFYRGVREVKATVTHYAGIIEIEVERDCRYLRLTPDHLREIADWAEKETP